MSDEDLRVLFIEDREEDAELLLRQLRRGGFEPTHTRVASEKELRAALGNGRFDLALCDWVLPGFSAQRAIQILEEQAFPGAVVVVSGSMGEEHVVDAMRSGAHDYVMKDNLHRLVPAIRREIREARVRHAVHIAEDALERQALIFENMHDGVVINDLDGRIIDINPAAERATGYSKAEVIGKRPEFLGAPGDEERLQAEIQHGIAEQGRWTGVLSVRRGDGSHGFIELVVVPLRDPRGTLVGTVGVSRDITERVEAEERLKETVEELQRTDEQRRALLSRLVAAQEEERQRIAAEIHDDPVQQLYAAGLRLGMLHERVDDPKERETLQNVQEILGGTIGRLRRMLFELQPHSLEAEGLGPALAEYIEFANQEGQAKYTLEDGLTAPLSGEIRAVAYRIILEAVSNIRKHADARKATIAIGDQGDGVLCSIADDGRGFLKDDHLDEYRPGHLGLPAMRERAELAGGRFDVSSAPGVGTTVEFWLPAS